ncbi:hypothetical protein G7Z17_g5365 [Cylindrodendrum hubeiense]|uniref:Uncharacterized protein n=1 Tax=Cylindrodendrum hubeiense TaxID=595255 RepID=A0A9P5HC06_9HYPO|nr:hypothetical protein G7Z17_g5365 [Cylindrodendrum hubeiense]
MDEQLAARVFDAAYGDHIRAIPKEEADAWWGAMDLTDKVAKRLAEKSGPDAEAMFRKALGDFAWEKVPLSATKHTLIHVFELLDDQALRAAYADFLDAPLDTAEQEAASRATLCRITGFPATMAMKSNTDEAQAQMLAIIEDAELRWEDQPERLEQFVTKLLKMGFEEDREEAFKDLIATASSEVGLVERLTRFKEDLDGKVEL